MSASENVANERTSATAARKIVLEHYYDAPRSLVFKAWTQPEHLVHWFHAAQGWTTPFAETDVRPGGRYRIGMGSPDGKNDFAFEGVYREVAEPERLVLEIGDGRPVAITFHEESGRTRFRLELTLENVFPEEQQRQGWTAMLDNLGKYLAPPR